MENTYWNRNGKHQATYNKLWDELVPLSGPAKTKEGELLRAMSRLYKRCYNDGDKIEPMLEEPVIDSSALNAWNYMNIRNIHGIVCTVGGRYGYRPQGNGNAFNKVE